MPEAIRYVATNFSKDYLTEKRFISILNDFGALKDVPAAKHLIENMQVKGLINEIATTTNWEVTSMIVLSKCIRDFGTDIRLAKYVIESVGYGLELTNNPPVFLNEEQAKEPLNKSTVTEEEPIIIPQNKPQVAPENLTPYDPKIDLPHYKYPTLDLLEDTTTDILSLKPVFENEEYQQSNMELPCAIGFKKDGRLLMFDLTESPHLMISGSSGMGLSVCMNTIIASLIYKKHPSEIKFILIDPKKIEFSIYDVLDHHFLAGLENVKQYVITDMSKASSTIDSLIVEMDNRFELFKYAHVRSITDYNKKFCERKLNPSNGHSYLPYIIVMIDEYEEFSRAVGKEAISKLLRMARAVGIHIIVSIQKLDASVMPVDMRTHFSSRISFRVPSSRMSCTILGCSGAEKLKNPGDLLYNNGIEVVEGHCAYLSIEEADRIANFISNQKGYFCPYYLPELPDSESMYNQNKNDNALDPLLEDAARLIVQHQQGSTSLIQRKLTLGYNRAGNIMDQLYKAGIVGPAMGSAPRDVLCADELALEQKLRKLKS